jgi:hypothetical protein
MGGRQGRREGGRKSRYKFPGKKKIGFKDDWDQKKSEEKQRHRKKMRGGKRPSIIFFKLI